MGHLDWVNILFLLFSAMTIVGAGLVIVVRDIVRVAFSLLFAFMGLAGLYLLLGAEFLSMIQILVYVGGILILILFGVMLTSRDPVLLKTTKERHLIIPGLLVGIVLFVGLSMVIRTVTDKIPADKIETYAVTLPVSESLLGEGLTPYDLAKRINKGLKLRKLEEKVRPVGVIVAREDTSEWTAEYKEPYRNAPPDLPNAIADPMVLNNTRMRLVRDNLHRPLLQQSDKGIKIGYNGKPLYYQIAGPKKSIETIVDKKKAQYGDAVNWLDREMKQTYVERSSPGIGDMLLTDYVLPFEVASILLLAALIGATFIARRREDEV